MGERRPVPAPPDAERPASMGLAVALAVSGVLHGALAATFLTWDAGPVPLPEVRTIVVELVSVAEGEHLPRAGRDTAVSASDTEAAGGQATEQQQSAGPAPEAPEPESQEAMAPSANDREAVTASEAPSAPTRTADPEPETVTKRPDITFRPAPPRPKPAPVVEPTPAAVAPPSTDMPQAPIDTASRPEAPLETAGLPDGGGPPATVGANDELGTAGLFTGPSFRLGSSGNPLPRYPSVARRRGWQGRVLLRVEVSRDGRPLSVRIAESSTHPALDEAAARAVGGWRFEPARQAGQPMAAWVDVPIVFRLRD